MKPLVERRAVAAFGVGHTSTAGIRAQDMPKILSIVSDQLYQFPILAVVREYTCNAIDAHIAAGIPAVPPSVTLPNELVPEFVVRDFGFGLSDEDMHGVYTMVGYSTKEETNDLMGTFGLGSKAGYAYHPTFTIISRHNGMCRTYSAYIDDMENRCLSLMRETVMTDDEKTGIEVRIPVRKKDFEAFQRFASQVFAWLPVRPDCFPEVDELDPLKDAIVLQENYAMLRRGKMQRFALQGWVAVMGGVAYGVQPKVLTELLDAETDEEQREKDKLVRQLLERWNGALYFEIGQVSPHPSRETLRMNRPTKRALLARLRELPEMLAGHASRELKKLQTRAESVSTWEQRRRLQDLVHTLGLWHEIEQVEGMRLWDLYTDMPTEDAPNYPQSFLIKQFIWAEKYKTARSRRKTRSLSLVKARHVPLVGRTRPTSTNWYRSDRWVEREACLLIQDCHKPLSRMREVAKYPGTSYWLVQPLAPDYSFDEEELQAFLKSLGADGVPTKRLSEFELPLRPRAAPSELQKTHYNRQVFRFNGHPTQDGRASSRWDPVDVDLKEAALTEDDIFVRIHRFEPVGKVKSDALRTDFMTMSSLTAEDVGEAPDLFGVKARGIKQGLQGAATHYGTWREKAFTALLQKKDVRQLLRDFSWSGRSCEGWSSTNFFGACTEVRRDHLRKHLGASHPIVQAAVRVCAADARLRSRPMYMRTKLKEYITAMLALPAASSGRLTALKLLNAPSKRWTSLKQHYTYNCGPTRLKEVFNGNNKHMTAALHVIQLQDKLAQLEQAQKDTTT